MNPNTQNMENPENKSSEEQTQLAIFTPPLATASLSLSLSTILPTHFLLPPKISSLLSQQPTKVKIPTQVSSLSHLSISSSLTPPKSFFKSTISASPLQNPLSLGPRRPADPSNAAGIRRASIVWFRNDLRVHDNECLNSANNESVSVLPVYCFDRRDYGKSSTGFDKTGPQRASFLIESVSDLRKNLQSKESNPEKVLVELAKAVEKMSVRFLLVVLLGALICTPACMAAAASLEEKIMSGEREGPEMTGMGGGRLKPEQLNTDEPVMENQDGGMSNQD